MLQMWFMSSLVYILQFYAWFCSNDYFVIQHLDSSLVTVVVMDEFIRLILDNVPNCVDVFGDNVALGYGLK